MQKSLALGKPIIPILCCGFEVDESIQDFQWVDMREQLSHKCMTHEDRLPLNTISYKQIVKTHYPPLAKYKPSMVEWLAFRISITANTVTVIASFPFAGTRDVVSFLGYLAIVINLVAAVMGFFTVYALISAKKSVRAEQRFTFATKIIDEAIKTVIEDPRMFYPKQVRQNIP